MGRAEHRDGATAAFPVSGLTARLLRRAKEPIGMIDVRQAAALQARASLFVRRSELLNDLMARHGLDQGSDGVDAPVASGTTLDAPLQRKVAAGQFGSAAASVGLPASEVGEVAGKPSALSAPQYRVKRPAGGGAPFNPAPRLQREVGETPTAGRAAHITDPPSARGTAAGLAGQGQDKLAPRLDGASSLPLARVGELRPLAAVTELHAAGQAIAPSSRNADRPASPVVAERIDGFAAAPNLRPASPLGDGAAGISGRGFDGRSPPRDATPGSRLETLPVGVAVAPTRPLAGGLPLQRKADHPPPSLALGSAQTASAMALVADARSHQPISREIPAPTLPHESPRIVWRNADANGAGAATTAQGSAVAAGVAGALGTVRRAVSGPTSGSDATPVRGPTFDVVRIADEVNRIIARQFRVELERRGRTR